MSRSGSGELAPVEAPAPRTALVPTRALARLFPESSDGRPRASLSAGEQVAIRLRLRLRLWLVRCEFRVGPALLGLRRLAVRARLRARLGLFRLRHRRRLAPATAPSPVAKVPGTGA